MAEKILNTRVQLKYDSYSEWEKVKSTFKPLKGEICIVNPGTKLNDASAVPCLMKVGDGENFFANLPWVSAIAADVYAWAKKATPDWNDFPALPIAVIDNGSGKFVTGITYADNKVTITRSDVAWGDVTDKPDFDNIYKTKQTAVTDPTAQGKSLTFIDTISQNRNGEITVTKKNVNLDNYATKAEAEAYADAKNQAIAIAQQTADDAQRAIDDYAATHYSNSRIDLEVANAQANAEEKAAELDTALHNTISEEIDSDIVIAINAEIVRANGAYDAKNAAATAEQNAKDYADSLASNYDAAGSADDALEAAKAYTDEVKADILGEGITETFDTLKEIEDWINAQGGSTVELTKAIADEAKARADADKTINDTIATLATQEALNAEIAAREDLAETVSANSQSLNDIYGSSSSISGVNVVANADRISALESASSDYATKEELSSLEGRINEDKANVLDLNLLEERVGAIENDYVNSEELSSDLSSLKSEITGDSSKTINDLDLAILDLAGEGNTATVKGNAEAIAEINDTKTGILAQAKAYSDSLNHEDTKYTAAADGGLKLDTNNGFAIDDSLVFVFDCGSATKNI